MARHVPPNFITEIIDRDLAEGRYARIRTRFPPEPNGYLHIGHARSIVLNFGLALDYGGECNLRFDDTNPETEKEEYARAIEEDVRWLGYEPSRVLYASDYFETMYRCALELIREGKAYVDDLPEEEMSALRAQGKPSPYRERSVEENLELFERMRQGEFPTGSRVLRAKIDPAHPNFKLRDPVLYRVVHAPHYHAGDRWVIYPLYDYAHPLEDLIEGVTHSLCTLEFENNRAVYDWVIENLKGKCGLPEEPRPHQYEFARLDLSHTVLSKRKLIRLVEGGHVLGWDDPRLPTLRGLRRRGVRPEAIREFVRRTGISRNEARIEMDLLEEVIRDDLNPIAPRVLGVVDPLKVVLTNYEGEEWIQAPYWPRDIPKEGTRPLPFSGELYIERKDFSLNPPKGWKRLAPGQRVRLRHAYVMELEDVVEEGGEVKLLKCRILPDTLGKNPEEGPKPKGVIHWVSARHALPVEYRLYGRLFRTPDPEEGGEFLQNLNPEALVVKRGFLEPSVAQDPPGQRYQLERLGYFWPDPVDSRPDRLVFNRIVPLKEGF
ncbi:glutamine--tRNA ligase/YqeY domain fusion protein [Thermus filiformis]|uniref:Glutamine--tRNA ligase n=1 Tax=Thermus filiformis TaxID=276 RepID=A0A0A2WQ90_THEFI|nr:glutamine--tRNA ligase/YqeY domain fusion protein [Thermus filiformis]KGQ22336.1 glutamate--tRNA ligase [Thermus filiformis]